MISCLRGPVSRLRGYTLVEILLAVALTVLVLEAALGLFLIGIADWGNKDDRLRVLSSALGVMNRLKSELPAVERILIATDKEIEFTRKEGIAAGTDAGVFRYDEPANNWEDINPAEAGSGIVTCLVESDTGVLFAGTTTGRVYKSIDRGRNWILTGPLTGATAVNCLLIARDNTIYAGTQPNGDVFKTTDEGVNWTNTGNLASGGINAVSVLSLAEAPDGTLYVGTAYVNSPSGGINLFKSTNGGTSWMDCSLFRNWWNTAYTYWKKITIYNSSAGALPTGYSVRLLLNHRALATAGKSLNSGDDIRLVYWNGSSYVELDRVNETVWNDDATLGEIWFRTQSAIAAGGSDSNYYLYYGNPAAGAPPANRANVYLLWDDFNTLDTVNTWNVLGAPTVTGGELRLGNGAAVATKLTYSNTFFETRLLWSANIASVWWGWFNNISATTPPYTRWRSGGTFATYTNFYPEKNNNAGSSYTGAAVANPWSFAIYKMAWGSSATEWHYNESGADRTTLGAYTQNQPIVIRNVNSANTVRVDWVKIRSYVSPEPVAGLGTETGRASLSCLSLLTVPTEGVIYAGTDIRGDVYKSRDNGVSWENTANITDAGTDATSVFGIITGTDSAVYLATSPNGNVFRTPDGGMSYQNTADLAGAVEVRVLYRSSDGNLYAGTMSNGDVFRSATNGQVWSNLSNITGATAVRSLSSISDRIKYRWSGNRYVQTRNPDDQLSRIFAGATYQLEEGLVKVFQLTYYKADHTPADTTTQSGRNEIKIIGVTLTMERNGLEYTLKDTIKIAK